MGHHKKQRSKENKNKKLVKNVQKILDDYEILENVAGYNVNLSKRYMEMMFDTYEQAKELEKKFGRDYIVERIEYDTNTNSSTSSGRIQT